MARLALTGFFLFLEFCSVASGHIDAEFELRKQHCFSAAKTYVCIGFRNDSDLMSKTLVVSRGIKNLKLTYKSDYAQVIINNHEYDRRGKSESKVIMPAGDFSKMECRKLDGIPLERLDDDGFNGYVRLQFTYGDEDEDEQIVQDVESAEKESGLKCKPFVIQKFVHSDNARFEYTFDYKLGKSVEKGTTVSKGSQSEIMSALSMMAEGELTLSASVEATTGIEFFGVGVTAGVKLSGSQSFSASTKNSHNSAVIKSVVADFEEQLRETEEQTSSMMVVVAPNQTIGFQQLAVKCGHVILRGNNLLVGCFGENCPDKSCDVEQKVEHISREELIELLKAAKSNDVGIDHNGAGASNSGEVTQFSAVLYMATICICIRHLLAWS